MIPAYVSCYGEPVRARMLAQVARLPTMESIVEQKGAGCGPTRRACVANMARAGVCGPVVAVATPFGTPFYETNEDFFQGLGVMMLFGREMSEIIMRSNDPILIACMNLDIITHDEIVEEACNHATLASAVPFA